MNRRGFFRFLGVSALVGATVPAQVVAAIARPARVARVGGMRLTAAKAIDVRVQTWTVGRVVTADNLNDEFNNLEAAAWR